MRFPSVSGETNLARFAQVRGITFSLSPSLPHDSLILFAILHAGGDARATSITGPQSPPPPRGWKKVSVAPPQIRFASARPIFGNARPRERENSKKERERETERPDRPTPWDPKTRLLPFPVSSPCFARYFASRRDMRARAFKTNKSQTRVTKPST